MERNISLPSAAFLRRHPIGSVFAGLLILFVLLVLLFDWNWVRPPIERYISRKTQREFRMDDLHVRLGLTPTIRMRGVHFGNADWSKEGQPMAKIEQLEFSVSLRDLPEKILVPRVALTRPELLFERLPDNRKNWLLSEPSETSTSRLRISTLSVDQGRLRYIDHGEPFDLDVEASTFDPARQMKAKDADAATTNDRYRAQYEFSGHYHGAGFDGTALTGEVLSFQESGVPFPIRGELHAGTTSLWVEGSIADAANISGIDTQLRIEGRTLSRLYPFLLLPLPASPPYRLEGHLILEGKRYTMDDLRGRIGSSDVFGKGAYIDQKPRPLLQADLHSNNLDLADLGLLIGIEARETKARQKKGDPDRLLPSGSFEVSRLQQIDAEVDLQATRLKVPKGLPLESLKASLRLNDAVMKLAPVDFGFAGGTLAGRATLDARAPIIKSNVEIDLQGFRLGQFVPKDSVIAKGAGRVGATLRLSGVGNSIADAAAKSNGRIATTVVNGRVSNLLDAASGLNMGKVLVLLAGGDKDIPINCGGAVFEVNNGRGQSSLLVLDTEQTQVLGDGWFDLGDERFDLTVAPKPKHVGLLSLRTPVRVYGSFSRPGYAFKKGPLIARGAAVAALTVVGPLASLVPLIETGPGQETDCGKVRQQTQGEARQANTPRKRRGSKPAPATTR
ncbi:AsmA protein [Variovorax sp. HW608]|uniref:AsmA family protein n=1 Tax=Variovorax sp. HW608 TaxID=1034889 RepID=UPI00081F9411|nr:AsmA family protein [Variovorax sp. HW608]SCK30384.1 AsmA protein [Variovorax sp. HW608]